MILKGFIDCKDMGKLILEYINYELSRNVMRKVAMHLRNCPNCMKKYNEISKRKDELKKILPDIEKRLRMERELSCYADKEAGESTIFIVETMLLCDIEYKKELIKNEKLSKIIKKAKTALNKQIKADKTEKIIQDIKNKNRKKRRIKIKLIRLFQPLHRAFLKFV